MPIIDEQFQRGVIEKFHTLEKAGKVLNLPHQAVIRREPTTTKVRIF